MTAETEVRRGLGHIFSIALVLRLASILLSTLLANFIQLGWHGIHSINLNLYISLTSWSRNECIRRVLQRFPPSKITQDKQRANHRLQQINLLVTAISIACCTYLWVRFPPKLVTLQSNTHKAYNYGMFLHMTAAIITALADPFYMQICYDEKYLVHARLETAGTCVFSGIYVLPNIIIATCLGQEWTPSSTLILSGVAQCSWALNLFLSSVQASGFTRHQVMDRLVSIIMWQGESSKLPKVVKDNLKLEVWTSIQKILVTEGDKLLILRYIDDEAKGAISIIMSLGGIITRVFFLSQEEMVNIHYSRHNLRMEEKRPKSIKEWISYFDVLSLVSSVQLYLGGAILAFGPPASVAVLRCTYGKRMLKHAYLLAGYCPVIFLMAVNGVVEGFFNSASDLKWLRRNRIVQMVLWLAITLSGALAMLLNRGSSHRTAEIWLIVTALYFASRILVPIIMLKQITKPFTNQLIQYYCNQIWSTVLTLLSAGCLVRLLPRKLSLVERAFQRFPLILKERLFNTECVYYFVIGIIILIILRMRLTLRNKIPAAGIKLKVSAHHDS